MFNPLVSNQPSIPAAHLETLRTDRPDNAGTILRALRKLSGTIRA
jgi:hypothetical protein